MVLDISESLRLLSILLYLIVCSASLSFPPLEQTALQFSRRQIQPKMNSNQNSRSQVKKLLLLESEVISFCWLIIEKDEMLHHAETNYHNSTHIKRLLTETQRINYVNLASADVIEQHPVLVFRMKRRIVVTWSPILEDIRKCEFISAFFQTTLGYRFIQLSTVMFREADLHKAIADILFLQRFYCLPTVRLVAGCVHGACVEPLTLGEVNDIAQSAVDKEDYNLALEWIEARLDPSCDQICQASSANEQLRSRTIRASALLMEGRYIEAKKAYQELFLHSNSSGVAIASILRTIDERLKSEPKNSDGVDTEQQDTRNNNNDNNNNDTVFECEQSLCLGQNIQAQDEKPSLMCYSLQLETEEDARINVEILNRIPKVVMIHDFLRKNQIEILQTTAKRKSLGDQYSDQSRNVLRDSSISGSYFAPTVDRIRLTSDDQWMDVIGSQFRNLTYWLNASWVENYKDAFHVTVTSVGIGQRNSFVSMESETNDEISGKHVGQFHIFLNKPEFGGCLVFPKLKVKVEPTQGAAVFWKFRSPSSLRVEEAFRDLLECPVLLGTQWIVQIPLLNDSLEILNF